MCYLTNTLFVELAKYTNDKIGIEKVKVFVRDTLESQSGRTLKESCWNLILKFLLNFPRDRFFVFWRISFPRCLLEIRDLSFNGESFVFHPFFLDEYKNKTHLISLSKTAYIKQQEEEAQHKSYNLFKRFSAS